VMNMIQTNIPAEPLENFRQLQIEATFQCDSHRIPHFVGAPNRRLDVLKLMLRAEQP
jgi:hypothetical protein